MKEIGDILGKKLTEKGKYRGPNSERADQVDQLMSFMGENPKDSKRFKYWLGRTRKLHPQEIYRLMREAKDGRNPRALFNYLLKNYGNKK